jgi:hypothetical protein
MTWPLSLEPQSFVTGVERLVDGTLKVYVGQRSLGLYTIIHDEDAAREVERAWGNPGHHVLIPSPPADCIFSDGP